MGVRFRKSVLLMMLVCMVILIGCADKDEAINEKTEPDEVEESIGTPPEQESEENINEEMEEEPLPIDEDIIIGGQVIVEEDRIRVLGESNLVEGTFLIGKLFSSPFDLKNAIGSTKRERVAVDGNGNFEMEFLFESYSGEDFLERYNGRTLEVSIDARISSQPNEIKEIYGEIGENLRGPFV